MFHSRLVIKDGNESDHVTFHVALDSETIVLEPRGAHCTFRPGRETPTLAFGFAAPEQAGRHDIFAEVTQKNRLLKVVAASLMVVL